MRECYTTLNVQDCISNISELIPKTLKDMSVHTYVSEAPIDEESLAKYIKRTVKDKLSDAELMDVYYNVNILKLAEKSTHIVTNVEQIRQIETQAATKGIDFDIDTLDEIAQKGVSINFTDNGKMYCISMLHDRPKYYIIGLDLCYKTGPKKVVFLQNEIVLINKKTNSMYVCDKMGDYKIKLEDTTFNCFKFKKEVLQYVMLDYYNYTLTNNDTTSLSRYDRIGSRLSAIFVIQELYKVYKQLRYNPQVIEYKVNSNEVKESHSVHQSHEYQDDTVVNRFVDLTAVKTKYVGRKYKALGGHHASPIEHNVSGHYRHYKNGKVIFIESFKRGKKKDYFEVTTNLV